MKRGVLTSHSGSRKIAGNSTQISALVVFHFTLYFISNVDRTVKKVETVCSLIYNGLGGEAVNEIVATSYNY